jgi:hypothetical protein
VVFLLYNKNPTVHYRGFCFWLHYHAGFFSSLPPQTIHLSSFANPSFSLPHWVHFFSDGGFKNGRRGSADINTIILTRVSRLVNYDREEQLEKTYHRRYLLSIVRISFFAERLSFVL